MAGSANLWNLGLNLAKLGVGAAGGLGGLGGAAASADPFRMGFAAPNVRA